MGAMGHADDVTIMSPSIVGLQSMLDVCSSFFSDIGVTLNESKSKLYVFSNNDGFDSLKCDIGIYVNNVFRIIKCESDPVHLGHRLSLDNSDDRDIIFQKREFCWRSNSVAMDFRVLSSDNRVRLLQTYCSSFFFQLPVR